MIRMYRSLPIPAFVVLVWLALLSPQGRAAVPTADGIYATFVVSRAGAPVGEFTCRLEYEKAPRTVASFVGLAEGSRAWVDFRRGGARKKPFYDGITFHRVVLTPSPFVIQAGSPNGLGNDGPGYAFHDEFHPDLRHSKAGILSMANSGEDTNGSQFFVTLAATSHLDDLHSVFGETVAQADLDVVNLVRQDDVIDSVTITRNGAAAQAFDVNAQGLPTVSDADPTIAKTQSGFELNYEQRDEAEYHVFHTEDFSTWSQVVGTEFYTSAPTQTPRDVSAITGGNSRKFFSVARVEYPEPQQVSVGVGNKITLDPASIGGVFTINLSTAVNGTYTWSQVQGNLFILSYTVTHFTVRPDKLRSRRVRLQASITGLAAGGDPITGMDLNLDFNVGNRGTASGVLTSQGGQQFGLSGPFEVTGL